jgi:hypothetical protein
MVGNNPVSDVLQRQTFPENLERDFGASCESSREGYDLDSDLPDRVRDVLRNRWIVGQRELTQRRG